MTSRKPDAMSARIKAEILDSFDEELEQEIDDDRTAMTLDGSIKSPEIMSADRLRYFKELFRLQRELVKLQDWVVHQKLKVVVIFEGRDAAGKGGVIKRIIGSGGRAHPAKGARGLPAARGADPLHGQPGRADVRADADRLSRPPDCRGRARRHRDPVGAAGAGERAPRARHDQPALQGRRRGTARGERHRPRVRACHTGGDPHALRPGAAEGGDADPRRVPDAGCKRADGTAGGSAGRGRS